MEILTIDCPIILFWFLYKLVEFCQNLWDNPYKKTPYNFIDNIADWLEFDYTSLENKHYIQKVTKKYNVTQDNLKSIIGLNYKSNTINIIPLEIVFSIALTIKERLKVLKLNSNIDSFKSQFDFFLFDIKNHFPEINLKCTETLTIEDTKPIIKHIEQQIVFIKQQITPKNKDILEQQLNAYFLLLVLCYNKIYKDLNNLSNEILKELS